MTNTAAPTFYPTFRCRDAAAMIDWLEKAFGFTTKDRFADDNGVVHHAEMTFGNSMLMLGSDRDDAFAAIVGKAGAPGGKSIYVAVDDADALFARASAAGATIRQGLTDRDYGSREFICTDPEGNVWCFGTYRPKV